MQTYRVSDREEAVIDGDLTQADADQTQRVFYGRRAQRDQQIENQNDAEQIEKDAHRGTLCTGHWIEPPDADTAAVAENWRGGQAGTQHEHDALGQMERGQDEGLQQGEQAAEQE